MNINVKTPRLSGVAMGCTLLSISLFPLFTAAESTSTAIEIKAQITDTTCEFGNTTYVFPEKNYSAFDKTYQGIVMGEISEPVLVKCEAGLPITVSFTGGEDTLCANNTGDSDFDIVALGYRTGNLAIQCKKQEPESIQIWPDSSGNAYLSSQNQNAIRMIAVALYTGDGNDEPGSGVLGSVRGSFPLTFVYP